MADSSSLKSVEQRLDLLERKVYRNVDPNQVDIKLTEYLTDVSNNLISSVASREKINSVFKRMEELEKYLDPEFGDKLALTDSSKMQILLAEEDQIRERVKQLEDMHELKTVLDSEHIKACPSFCPKLQQLSTLQVDQQVESQKQTQDVQELVNQYNQLLTIVNKQFVAWDDLLTKIEVARQAKKNKD